MIRFTTLIMFFFSVVGSNAQNKEDKSENAFLKRIFLPSIDVGYQHPNSNLIEGSLKFATSIEYRFKNNNDFFIRLNYDTYSARYLLSDRTATTNTIEGTVQISDFFIAPGYRFGDQKYRFMLALMPGIKLYEFPSASVDANQIQLRQEGKSLFTTSILGTFEYYFDEKSAFTFGLFQNRVWKQVDFWEDGRSAIGFSIGFITALM